MIDVKTCLIKSYTFFLNFWVFVKRFISINVALHSLPGPPRENVFVGNIGILRKLAPDELFKQIREWSKQFSPVYKLYIFPVITANITSPEDCGKILSNPKNNRKSRTYWLLHRWLRSGLLTSSGRKWQARRKILTPSFHFSILQRFSPILTEEAENLVETFRQESRKNPIIEINEHVTQFTLKSIAETAMGVKLTFQTQDQKEYKNAVYNMGKLVLYKIFRPLVVILELCHIRTSLYREETELLNVLHGYTKTVIKKREEDFTEPLDDLYGNKKRFAMLDLLLSAKKDNIIDDAGIQEEVDTFLFEGHDTTSMALSFSLMLIACHQEVQQKIVNELLAVSPSGKATFNNLQQMKYLDRCIKEVLRLYPSVPFIARMLGEEVTTTNGFQLPAGSTVHIHIYDIHHNPEIYPEPEKFDPDRFLPENCIERHAFAYLGFSAGPRNCIGQRFAMLELKAAIAGVLSNFLLEPVDRPDDIQLIADLVLRPKRSIRIKFSPRVW